MVEKVIRIYSCDACGKEIDAEKVEETRIKGVVMDESRQEVYNHGRNTEIYVKSSSDRIDLCLDCKKKYDMIKAYFVNDMLNLFKRKNVKDLEVWINGTDFKE